MKVTVKESISKAKYAHQQGKLAGYQPLISAGSDQRASTALASWGPAMRR